LAHSATTALPRTTFQQVYAGTPIYPFSDFMPGDLLFTPGSDGAAADPGHVGMYIGSGWSSRLPRRERILRSRRSSVKGLAPSTVETIYVIFASTMRGAVRDGYLRKSPCVDIRLPEKIPTVVRLLTPAEVLALADAMPGRYSLLVLLGAGTGLRRGEGKDACLRPRGAGQEEEEEKG
jgi:hypothetical protein